MEARKKSIIISIRAMDLKRTGSDLKNKIAETFTPAYLFSEKINEIVGV